MRALPERWRAHWRIAAAVVVAVGALAAPSFGAVRCPGDLDDDRLVGIDELVRIVDAALGGGPSDGPRGDLDGDGRVTVDEAVSAVRSAQRGCPSTHFPLNGPGPHWIDRVESGTLTFDAVATLGLDFDGNGTTDSTATVQGSATLFRSVSLPGNPADPGHRNHLGLEIVDMALGNEEILFRAGDGRGNLASDGPLSSIGTSDELPDSPELARDLFAVSFEVEAGTLMLHNRDPLMVEATIDRLPPIGSEFRFDGPAIRLYNETGGPTSLFVTSVLFTPLDPDR